MYLPVFVLMYALFHVHEYTSVMCFLFQLSTLMELLPDVCVCISYGCILLVGQECVICLYNTPSCVHELPEPLWQKSPLEDNKLSVLASCAYWEICLGGLYFPLPLRKATRHRSISTLADRVSSDGETDNSQASYSSSRGKYP